MELKKLNEELDEILNGSFCFYIKELELKGEPHSDIDGAYEEALIELPKLGFTVGELNDSEFIITSDYDNTEFKGTIILEERMK